MEILGEGKYLQLVKADGKWEYVRKTHKDAVAIIAIAGPLHDRYALFVEEYRHPLKQKVISLPAGIVGDIDTEESLEECAKKELLEETGYKCGHIHKWFDAPTSPGMTDEWVHMFSATNCVKVSDGGGDETENITVHEVPIGEVENWFDKKISEGFAIPMYTYAGWFYEKDRG